MSECGISCDSYIHKHHEHLYLHKAVYFYFVHSLFQIAKTTFVYLASFKPTGPKSNCKRTFTGRKLVNKGAFPSVFHWMTDLPSSHRGELVKGKPGYCCTSCNKEVKALVKIYISCNAIMNMILECFLYQCCGMRLMYTFLFALFLQPRFHQPQKNHK